MSNEPKPWTPPELTSAPNFATDEQIEAVVKVYVDEMRERGHIVGLANVEHLERAARIQDVWRGAFAHVLDAPKPAALPPDLTSLLHNFGVDNMKKAPPAGTTILPPGALQELLDAARGVLGAYESLLDSDYSTAMPGNWKEKMPDAEVICKRLRDLLP